MNVERWHEPQARSAGPVTTAGMPATGGPATYAGMFAVLPVNAHDAELRPGSEPRMLGTL